MKKKNIGCAVGQFLLCIMFLAQLLSSAWSQTNAHPDVDAAKVAVVTGNKLKLSPSTPNAWKSGSPLPDLLTGNPGSGVKRITEQGALDPKSLVLKFQDRVLVEGKDYILDAKWGVVGMGPHSSVTTSDTVTARYRYSLLRLDSIVRDADRKEHVQRGKSEITTPHPPSLAAGETRVANIYVPYFSDGTAKSTLLFPVLETAAQAKTFTTSGRIPKTMRKIKSGRPVKIICWGDSLTTGGDASLPMYRYPALLERSLERKFPAAKISVHAVAAAASTSRMWLYPEKFSYQYRDEYNPSALSWQKVIESKPDLVTIEFLNDAYIDAPQHYEEIYADILKRLKDAGAEVILITPSFTDLATMHFTSYNEEDGRSYTRFLRGFATEHSLGLADASSRWGHLVKEGIPYTTYLVNSLNHPDNRGHQIFAEEILKNFE